MMELSYISKNGNPKNLFIFQEVTFQARKIKKSPKKISYISGNRNTKNVFLYIFLKENFSYISGNVNAEKNSLCCRKLFIFQEVTFQDQKCFILFLIKKQNFLN